MMITTMPPQTLLYLNAAALCRPKHAAAYAAAILPLLYLNANTTMPPQTSTTTMPPPTILPPVSVSSTVEKASGIKWASRSDRTRSHPSHLSSPACLLAPPFADPQPAQIHAAHGAGVAHARIPESHTPAKFSDCVAATEDPSFFGTPERSLTSPMAPGERFRSPPAPLLPPRRSSCWPISAPERRNPMQREQDTRARQRCKSAQRHGEMWMGWKGSVHPTDILKRPLWYLTSGGLESSGNART